MSALPSPRPTPPFRADHVGSLLRPAALLEAREKRRRGGITREQLTAMEDEAIRDAIKLQEDLGLKAVTDGEFRRTLWHMDFLTSFANVKAVQGKVTATFHSEAGATQRTPSALAVTGKIARPKPIFLEAFKFVKAAAKAMPKLTIPSPSIVHFRGGRDAIDKLAYPSLDLFYADLARVYDEEIKDLADAGCRYLQIDEVNFAYLCDPNLRQQVKDLGENPDTLPATYAKLINDSIRSRPKDMVVCMHLCRGNLESAWMAEGGYEPVAEVLFNQINVTGYFLEYDSERAGGFEPLRFLPKGKVAVLGLVTSKTGKLETKDSLKRRIDQAAKFAPLEQLALSPQCGFASGERGNKLLLADEIAKLKLVVETAREVWGGV
jgi:5-methyltetrahydropteroyltriglutamate--homocysteine methyltransferase